MARSTLPQGYQLHWYRIEAVLGQGGFGITYLAEDTNLNQQVAIKEYLPASLAHREKDDSVVPVTAEEGKQYEWGLERFISEAQLLAQFKHPNIVRALTVFTENNTAYMIMEFEHGRALDKILKERITLTQGEIEAIIFPLFDGLSEVHKAGFIHRDIKPANIYIRENGSAVLLDFGSARQALGSQTHTLTTMVSPGFAPFEQYVSKSDKQGSWTDIYGLAATIYRAASGRSPSDAMDRSDSLLNTQTDTLLPLSDFVLNGFSYEFIQAVDKGLEFTPEKRPQSVEEWKALFIEPKVESLTLNKTLIASTNDNLSEADSEVDTLLLLDAGENETDKNSQEAGSSTLEEKPNILARCFHLLKHLLKWLVVLFIGLFLLSLCEERVEEKNTDQKSASKDGKSEEQSSLVGPSFEEISKNVISSQSAKPVNERLVSSIDREEIEALKQLLAKSNNDEKSRAKLKEITDLYARKIKRALNNNDFNLAKAYAEEMNTIFPNHPRIKKLINQLEKGKKP